MGGGGGGGRGYNLSDIYMPSDKNSLKKVKDFLD